MNSEAAKPILDYLTPGEERRFIITRQEDDQIEIVVPSIRRSARRIWDNCMSAEFLGIILFPLVLLMYVLLARPTPRAVLRLTGSHFVLTESSDDGFGWSQWSREWERTQILELRQNRFDAGLYLRIAGAESLDLLNGSPTRRHR